MTDQLDHSIRAALEEIGDHAPRVADVRSPRQVSERPLALVRADNNRVSPARFSLTSAPAPAAPGDPASDSLVLLAPETIPAGYRQIAARTQASSSALTGSDLTLDEIVAGVVVGNARVQADEEWWFDAGRNSDFERIGNVTSVTATANCSATGPHP